MHPAVYMTLTKVLIESDARHSLPLDPPGQHQALLLHSRKEKQNKTLCSFLTRQPESSQMEAVCLLNPTLNAYVSGHNANVSLM